MSNISIRVATIEDLDVLLEFEQGVIKAERPLDPFLKSGLLSYYDIPKLIQSKTASLIVAVDKNELVGSGYVRIENSSLYHKNALHGYIGFMYVKPSHRGKKISNFILQALKDWAKQNNLKELRLDVYYDNVGALKAYERFGFIKSLLNMRMDI